MTKETLQKVLISCSCFLLLVSIAAHYLRKQEAQAVNAEVESKVVYLTFDDGPSKNTQGILDVLKEKEVSATFFVTGQNEEFIDLIKTEYDLGHSIGVHTYSHDFKEIYSSVDAYMNDLEKMNDIIRNQTGSETKVMRFPGGVSNTVSRKYCSGIMTSLSDMVTQKGYRYYDWNASNGDGECGSDASALVRQALKESNGKNEVILLMHDGSCNKGTVTALPDIIDGLKSQGYEFKTIDTSTQVVHHQIAN